MREANLDNSGIILMEKLTSKPLHLNLLGNALTIYCTDNIAYHYGLHISSGILSS